MNQAAFNKWWEDERKEKSGSPRHPTRGEIWDYFHREFPREAVEAAALDWADSDYKITVLVNALERLLNGDQEGVITGPIIPSDMICDNCGQLQCVCTKPACPTCGERK